MPYLEGEPDSYKTTMFMQICHEEGWRVYKMGTDLREFYDFDPSEYDIILWDEFEPKVYNENKSRIKQMLEGCEVIIDIKCEKGFKLNINNLQYLFGLIQIYPRRKMRRSRQG